MARVEKALQSKDPQSMEFQCSTSGCHYEVRFIVSGEDKVLLIISNVSRRKETEAKLEYLAHYDSLTDLPNRYMFNDRLAQAIAHAERKKQLLAILFLDIDNFKHINDTIGHKMGDQLLQKIASRLMTGMRKTDSIVAYQRRHRKILWHVLAR